MRVPGFQWGHPNRHGMCGFENHTGKMLYFADKDDEEIFAWVVENGKSYNITLPCYYAEATDAYAADTEIGEFCDRIEAACNMAVCFIQEMGR